MADMFPVLRVLGILVMVFALAMGLPLGGVVVCAGWCSARLPLAMGFTLCVGAALWWGMRRHARELQPRHGPRW